MFVILGIYLAIFQVSPTNLTQIVLGAVLVITGIAVAILVRLISQKAVNHPTRLEIHSDGFSLDNPGAGSPSTYAWSDPKLAFTLQDATGIREGKRLKMDPAPYIILYGNGKRSALPKEAFDLLLRDARTHQLSIARSEWGSETSRWGALVNYVVKTHRKH
jgi:hypothetical protein